MKISYQRDPLNSYMVIDAPHADEDRSFALRMLSADPLPELLSFREESINGDLQFFYDISGKQSFEKAFETHKLSYEVLTTFLHSLKDLYDGISEHLLDIDSVLISQGSIFLDHSFEHFWFCFLPGGSFGFLSALRELFNEILSYIDYDDRKSAELAFDLCRISQTENYTLSEIFSAVKLSEGTGKTTDLSPHDTHLNAELPESPGPLLPQPVSYDNDRFLDKAKRYFKGKSFSEVFDAVNSGKIIRQIRDVPAPYRPQIPFSVNEDTLFSGSEFNIPVSIPGDEPVTLQEDDPVSNTSSLNAVSLNMKEITYHCLTGQDKAQGIVICLDHFPFTIGKSQSRSDYRLDRPTISRVQCRIHERPGGILEVEDMNSRNGTFVNNIILNPYEYRTIQSGDAITLSDMKFVLS